jgi:hypothetical protein
VVGIVDVDGGNIIKLDLKVMKEMKLSMMMKFHVQ